MKVKDAIKVLKNPEAVFIEWNGVNHELNTADSVELDAYGDYMVDNIQVYDYDKSSYKASYQISIVTRPVRVTE